MNRLTWAIAVALFVGGALICWADPPSRALLRGNPAPYACAYFHDGCPADTAAPTSLRVELFMPDGGRVACACPAP